MSKALPFFATNEDLIDVVRAVEAEKELQYALAGMFDERHLTTTRSVDDVEAFGIAQIGDQAHETRYLVTNADADIVIREVPQRRGGTRYAVDQVANPHSVMLVPGGVFGKEAVISGQVGTASSDAEALSLYKVFEREIKRRFSKIKSYYIGPKAKSLFDAGARLTTSVGSPVEYDLRR